MPKYITDSLSPPHPHPEEGRAIERAMDAKLGELGEYTHMPTYMGQSVVRATTEELVTDLKAAKKSEAAWQRVEGDK